MIYSLQSIIFIALISLSFISCNQKQKTKTRVYSETVLSKTNINTDSLSWKLPKNWFPYASSNELSLASFMIVNDAKLAEVSITKLEGQVGNTQSNIERWMKQIKLTPFSEKKLDHFIQKQTEFKTTLNQTGLLIDFTQILSGDITENESILAAIINLPNSKLFIKAKGPKKLLIKHKNQFSNFSKSIYYQSKIYESEL